MIERNFGTSIVVNGKKFLYFGGTNYLSLAHRQELWAAASEAFNHYGFSASASRLTSGESTQLRQLEHSLASFAGSECALVLPSGYQSNAAVVEALDDAVDMWMVQKNAHPSIVSAVGQSRKPVLVNSDLSAPLMTNLKRRSSTARIGVFAEPLNAFSGEFMELGLFDAESSSFLVLDEAHSFGVIGDGRGAIDRFGFPDQENIIRTGTFSKALGTQGGFVLGTRFVIDLVRSRSGVYRSSTPLSPVIVAASQASLALLSGRPESTVGRLRTNISRMNEALGEFGRQHSPEVPIYCKTKLTNAVELHETLAKEGVFVPSVINYFADDELSAIRWTLQADHTADEIDRLTTVLRSNT